MFSEFRPMCMGTGSSTLDTFTSNWGTNFIGDSSPPVIHIAAQPSCRPQLGGKEIKNCQHGTGLWPWLARHVPLSGNVQ
jgi:hypothetical protein